MITADEIRAFIKKASFAPAPAGDPSQAGAAPPGGAPAPAAGPSPGGPPPGGGDPAQGGQPTPEMLADMILQDPQLTAMVQQDPQQAVQLISQQAGAPPEFVQQAVDLVIQGGGGAPAGGGDPAAAGAPPPEAGGAPPPGAPPGGAAPNEQPPYEMIEQIIGEVTSTRDRVEQLEKSFQDLDKKVAIYESKVQDRIKQLDQLANAEQAAAPAPPVM